MKHSEDKRHQNKISRIVFSPGNLERRQHGRYPWLQLQTIHILEVQAGLLLSESIPTFPLSPNFSCCCKGRNETYNLLTLIFLRLRARILFLSLWVRSEHEQRPRTPNNPFPRILRCANLWEATINDSLVSETVHNRNG